MEKEFCGIAPGAIQYNMHPFFQPLHERDAMTLLATLTLGGGDEVGILNYLPVERRQAMQQKAKSLLDIPAEKRVAFMVHELKQAFAAGERGSEKIDATWLLEGFKGERARVVGAILMTFSAPAVKGVLRVLPQGIRDNLPPKEELRRVPLDLLRGVRQIFEGRFLAVPEGGTALQTFADLVHLDSNKLLELLRELGLIELGQAFASVGKMALSDLCRRLPREKAEELIGAVKSASGLDLPEPSVAQRFLSRVVVNFRDTEEFFNKAGLWRLAKASLPLDQTFLDGLRLRLPKEIGQLLVEYVAKAREMADINPENLGRLQEDILARAKAKMG